MDLLEVLLWSLIPTTAMLVGGLIALVRPANSAARSIILHFAAGIVFSVVAVELLPDIIKRHAPIEVLAGFAAGVICMLFLRLIGKKISEGEKDSETKSSTGMLFGVAVDVIVDGLLLGVGCASGTAVGIPLTIALSVELLSLGVAVSTSLQVQGMHKKNICFILLGVSNLLSISSVAGMSFLPMLNNSNLEIVLSFGLAALLFLVTEELLVEAHEEKETPIRTTSFMMGFISLLIFEMVIK